MYAPVPGGTCEKDPAPRGTCEKLVDPFGGPTHTVAHPIESEIATPSAVNSRNGSPT